MHRSLTTRQRPQPRTGFTLTEMLVATGLVVLIMLMFAQIYAVAIGTLREQRGLAQNDQKARVVANILRNDLQNMTYRQPAFPYGDVQGIVALAAGDQPIIDPVNQRGYFYYSENVREDDSDDVLQFTVQIGAGHRGDVGTSGAQRPYIGKTKSLSVGNQPSADNGSSAAEVCYFLRHGILYRRVLLLRDPLPSQPSFDPQPGTLSGVRRFNSSSPNYTLNTQDFYRDFDYSATRNEEDVLWFHSVQSLDNSSGTRNVPIARPLNRFGFGPGGTAREFGNDGKFIGRFTVQETSHGDFNWPGFAANNPHTRGDLNDTDADGVLDPFASSNRVGEDILLTNVEAFDIKVLTEWLGARFENEEATGGFDTTHPNAGGAPKQTTNNYFDVNSVTDTWSAGGTPAVGSRTQVPVLGNRSMYYEVVASGTNGNTRPEFPPVPGTLVADGTTGWKCVDNRRGVKAIRITIRFRDTTSNIPRQLTLVHSFVE